MTTATYAAPPTRYERDEDLASALASRAPEAWRQLFDEQYDAVYHYAQLRTASAIDATDIALAVFSHAPEIAERFHGSRTPTVVRMLEITERTIRGIGGRSRASRRHGVSNDALREAIARLAPNERTIVLLRLIEAHSTDVTAHMLRTSAQKARVQQMRALQHLSREHGGFGSDGLGQLDGTLDGCIDQLIRGDPLEGVLSAQHGRMLELLPILRVAYGIVRLPRDPAPDSARSDALTWTMRNLEVARFQNPRPLRPTDAPAAHSGVRSRVTRFRPPGIRLPRPALRISPRAWRGAALAFAALVIAAGAAAGVIAIREASFDAFSGSDPPSNVLVKGTPLTQRGNSLWIAEGSELQRIETSPDTVVLQGEDRTTLDGLSHASRLEVIGVYGVDGTLHAAMVRIRDDQ